MIINEIERLVAKALADSDLPEEKAVPLLEEISESLSVLRRYLTRGGFIQDKNGKWCKEGDTVRYRRSDPFGRPNVFIERVAKLEYTEGQHLRIGEQTALFPDHIELIRHCEPNICANFKKEEEEK